MGVWIRSCGQIGGGCGLDHVGRVCGSGFAHGGRVWGSREKIMGQGVGV